jgi:hypothetical protein
VDGLEQDTALLEAYAAAAALAGEDS